MPRWFHRRAAVITWAGLATLGLTPLFVSSLVDDEPETIEQPQIRSNDKVRAVVPATEADPEYRIDAVEHPVVVHVEVGSAEQLCTTGYKELLRVATRASHNVLPVATQQLDKVVAIHLRDIPPSFSSLPASDRRSVVQRFGPAAPAQYESSVALLLDTLIHEVQDVQPRAMLSVVGLPVEPEEAGVSIEIAQQSNERYSTVIDRLNSFVPGRTFVVAGTGVNETRIARTRMREALRLRDGRPVVFQTNAAWRALMDADGPGYADYQIAGSTGQGVEIEASLSD